MTSLDVLVVLFAAIGYLSWKLYRFLAVVYGSPLRVLPGPPQPKLGVWKLEANVFN